jgi:MFS family permease
VSGEEAVSAGGPPGRPATVREVFAVREFRALFGTFVLSTIGDELARVALTVLVYQRTSSPLLSAITFAIGYLPWLLGGPVLSALADRLPRHRVLIVADVARAVLVAAMALPGVPLPALLVLLLLVSLGAPPFESARSALQADLLDPDRYAVASSVTNITMQLTQVLGFVLAGALVAVVDPAVALVFDAATFAVSAAWLAARLRRRPAPTADSAPRTLWQDTGDGLRLIARTPRLRAIVLLLWTATLFTTAPEGLVAPFARELGQGSASVGVLLAANPLGVTLGGLVVARFLRPDRRERVIAPLVVLALAALALAGVVAEVAGPGRPVFAAVVALSFVSGLGAAWAIPLNVSFVQAVAPSHRGRAFGVAVSGLSGAQGIGVLAAGALAEELPPGGVVAVCGGLGLLAVVLPLLAFARSRPGVASPCPAAGASVP